MLCVREEILSKILSVDTSSVIGVDVDIIFEKRNKRYIVPIT